MDGTIKHLCEAGTRFCVLIMPGYKARLCSKWFSIQKCFSKCIIFFNRGRKLVATCRKLYLPDDMTVGALIGTLALAYCAAMVVMYVLFLLQKES